MYLVLCTNTDCDVTDSVNHGMVKYTKTWISWEHNIRWHILRSYCFVVVEVTFKQIKISDELYKDEKSLIKDQSTKCNIKNLNSVKLLHIILE